MTTGLEMRLEMDRQSSGIGGDDDKVVFLRPAKQFGVTQAELKVIFLANASDAQWNSAPRVVPLQGCPERTAQVLVEQIA
jgi:hypothetical protein